jgi:uncharacterized membrane protein
MSKVLLAGESWITHSIHIKGFDSFTTSEYVEGAGKLIEALETAGTEVTFLPNHVAPSKFPGTASELSGYDAVILSDIGANSLLLHPRTFALSESRPNRIAELLQYVRNGGGLAMIGGYLSFSGIEGKAGYPKTEIADVLPVLMTEGDDRREMPQGAPVDVVEPDHPVLKGISSPWPKFLGYNRLRPRPGATIVARCGDDVFLAVGEYGKGRTLAFASDCGPHWGPPQFVEWKHYPALWRNFVQWLSAGR